MRSGHPGRGVPTFLCNTVGNGLRAVPQSIPKRPPYPGESAQSTKSVIARPSGRGNLLVKCSVLLDVSGVGPMLTFGASITSDCTGRLHHRHSLRSPRRFAPRNDSGHRGLVLRLVIRSGHPGRGVPTETSENNEQAPAKLPEPDFYAQIQLLPNWKNATALAAATLRESTPWVIGILTV